jgi:mannose-6-phosphate isomerase-like protein (cupin superfamily)
MKDKAMSAEYFAPKGIDTQLPHSQDEVYVIASGSSEFVREDEMVNCKTGDVLFVPAGMVHRFQNFSDDFATWVVFY